ncbi:DUF4124 domain-containing protein [Marinobacter xestospongiae]|uniref:DUF4124 domain-containing protein n=1 Tax=Marinobacter xestospongiae TaxID=994319 RepID=A0ABU3VVS7_9GAMM|nr:DUF4124 domain-containing protein [Marinobacter xestospongiae]MDV2078378.1 DUF4124 domain-containing protein [Marinobacter xestospongiae]
MIMRWLIRLAFPALGLLLLLIFFGITDPETVASTDATESPDEQIPAFEGLVPSPVPLDGPDVIFKWQDSDGGWHYADSPPEKGPWNALAVEPNQGLPNLSSGDPETDWQSPYHAPFALSPGKDS